MRKLILIALTFVAIFYSCKKESTHVTTLENELSSEDILSPEQLQILDAMGIDSISTFKDALFADGRNMNKWRLSKHIEFPLPAGKNKSSLSASDQKDLFIASMTNAGFYQINYIVPSQPNGLAYVFGSKSFANASIGTNSVCQQPLYGVDCSGMIYQMAIASNLNLPAGGTANYIKTKIWNTAFSNSPDFQGLTMTDLLELDPSQFQAGDIIVAAGIHMGMIFNNGNSLGIFNSPGSQKNTCEENQKPKRGPYISTDVQKWVNDFFKSGYHVLRVVSADALPVLTTTKISAITSTTAASGGTITSDGGSPITARGVCWSTSKNPTIADSKTTNGTGTGGFSSSLTGLTANTLYYARAYATNSAGTSYGTQKNFTTQQTTGSVTDIDGNVYNTVIIGTQVWMVENLKTSHYRNGDAIPTGLSDADWQNITSGAYAIYNNKASNDTKYGKLYNWYAVSDTRNICPVGWHIPTKEEWGTLVTFLGGGDASVAGGKMKSLNLWKSPNTGATNSSGFTGLPGGLRFEDASFEYIGTFGVWWTFTENFTNTAFYEYLYYDNSGISWATDSKSLGCSIRCVKD